jgi:hypothetical protein
MADDDDPVARALMIQAGACVALGSVFSGALLERAAADWTAEGPSRALLAPWREATPRSLISDAVPLRLLGALHDLVLSGAAPNLAVAYPAADHAGDAGRAWTIAREEIATHSERLTAFMTHEPQTNEVRRSACLLPGFLTIATRTGLDLRCFELAASAGLNQLWDRYHYDLGAAGAWGEADAPVFMDTGWRGPPPPLGARIRVTERAACDRTPVELADPAARRRLRAYIWADQIDRLARLESAIAAALEAGTRVEAEDAVTWAARIAAPRPGAATVLYHSVFWQYMPAESQTALSAVIASHGESATAGAPFAWLRMGPPPTNMALMELRLTLWPGGEDRILAHVHPHGAWVEWMG